MQACMWRSKDSLRQTALTFYNMGSKDGTQVLSFANTRVHSATLLVPISLICSLSYIIINMRVNIMVSSKIVNVLKLQEEGHGV